MALFGLWASQRKGSWLCSVSGQVRGRQTTPLQDAGPFAFAPIPPVRPLVQDLSSGDLISSLQQSAQQPPLSAGILTLNGGVQESEDEHFTFAQGFRATWIASEVAKRAKRRARIISV